MQGERTEAGAGRAIEAAWARRHGASASAGPQRETTAVGSGSDAGAKPEADRPPTDDDGQQGGIAGPGYPVADRDGTEPGAIEELENDGWADLDLDGDDEGPMDDGDPGPGGVPGAGLAPPEAGRLSIEEEPFDTSILPDAHAEKAAWNRARLAAAEPGAFGGPEQGDDPALDPAARSVPAPDLDPDLPVRGEGAERLGDIAGTGGGAGEEGRRMGLGRRGTETQHGDLSLRPEHEELDPDVIPEVALGEQVGAFEDEGTVIPEGGPVLPEHRDFLQDGADEEIPLEERLLDGEGEDPSFAGGEIGTVESLEPEDLNETDDITRSFEETRADLNDSADGNERHGGRDD